MRTQIDIVLFAKVTANRIIIRYQNENEKIYIHDYQTTLYSKECFVKAYRNFSLHFGQDIFWTK